VLRKVDQLIAQEETTLEELFSGFHL
jgi:hypothetical protein